MKKVILFIALILSATFVNAQDTTAVSEEVTSTEIYRDVKAAITSLAESFSVKADYVFDVLVRQQYVYSVVYTLGIIVGLLLCLLAYKFSKKANWDKGNYFCALTIISTLAGCVIFGISIAYLPELITGFINPEYGAIQDIFDVIKGN